MAAQLCLGVVIGARGVKGEVRIKSFAENPTDIAAYGPLQAKDGRTFKVTAVSAAEGVVIARINGVDDRDAADALKGVELFIDRAALPAPETGTFYQADLVGLAVERISGEPVGKVVAFHNFGGGDLMEVALVDGQGHGDTVFLPFTAAVIANVDMTAGKVVVTPVPGLLDDDASAANDDESRGIHVP